MAHIEIDPAELAVQSALNNFLNELIEQVHFARRKYPGRENTWRELDKLSAEMAVCLNAKDHSAILECAVGIAVMAFRCHFDGDASWDKQRIAKGLGPSGFPGELEADPLADAKAEGRKALGL